MDLSGDTIAIRLIVIIILLGPSAFFSSSETVLTTVNKARIRNLAESGNQSVVRVMKLGEGQGKMLSAILIGNNVVNLSASFMLTVLATEVFGGRATGAATGIPTLLILISGRITPKIIATLRAEENALRSGHVIYTLMVLLTSVIATVNRMSFDVLKPLDTDSNKRGDDMTEDELHTIVEVGHERDVIESKEEEMINNVFDLGDSVAKDTIVPRIDMTFTNVNAGFSELSKVSCQEHYTRLPVHEETTDNVVSIINIKDMLLIKDRKHLSIDDHLQQPFYTSESKKLSEFMVEMRGTSNNIVIVLDGYGATAGLITLEDTLEEIVGGIRDKYDEDEEDELVVLGENQHLVEGTMKLDSLNHKLGLELASEDYDSVGGSIIDKLEYLPAQGEEAECDGVRLVVEQVDRNRIDKIHFYPHSHSEKEEDWSTKSLHSGAIYDGIRRYDKEWMISCY